GRGLGQGRGEDFIKVAALEARLIHLDGSSSMAGLAEIGRRHHYRLLTARTLNGNARFSPGNAHELIAMGAAEAYWHGSGEWPRNNSGNRPVWLGGSARTRLYAMHKSSMRCRPKKKKFRRNH